MQCSFSDQKIDCLGKCLDLTCKELDQITDNVYKTLINPKGNELFANYLEEKHFQTNLECLHLYNKCSECLAEEQKNRAIRGNVKESELREDLLMKMRLIEECVDDLDGVPEIDMDLMKKFKEAFKKPTKEALLTILEDTRDRCQNHLRGVHELFKEYILERYSMKLQCKKMSN